MQNWKRNWLVASKLTWGLRWVLTQALENLKNLHFNGLSLTKVCNAWVKKRAEELCLMALNNDAKFEGKLICTFKNDMRNLGNFHQSTWKSRNWDFDGILLSKFRKYMSLKFTGELFVMTMKKYAKLEEELTFGFKIDMRTLMSFDPSTRNLKNLHYNGLPLTKICNVWVKRYRWVMFDGIEYWCKIRRKTDFCFQKWHEEFGKFPPENLNVSKLGFW